MSDEEIGKTTYEAFLLAHNGALPAIDSVEVWETQSEHWKCAWIAAGKAVVNRVLELQSIAVEASE